MELRRVAQHDQDGAVYCMSVLKLPGSNRKFLVTGVNAMLSVYSLEGAENSESPDYTLQNKVAEESSQILIYKIKTREDGKILVADIMRSLTVYELDPDATGRRLKTIARNPYGQWCFDML